MSGFGLHIYKQVHTLCLEKMTVTKAVWLSNNCGQKCSAQGRYISKMTKTRLECHVQNDSSLWEIHTLIYLSWILKPKLLL